MRTPYDPPKSLPGPSAFDPGRRGVKVLGGIALVVALTVAYFTWQSRPHEEPVTPVWLSSSPQEQAETQLVVAVSGLVRHPGLVRLPPGSRVADAIQAAGGALPGADLSAINLARKLTDGELIAIGVPGVAGVPQMPAKVNLNTATQAQLDTLPGVGPVLAQRIIDYRTRHGGFREVSQLRQVDGIGEETYARLKDLVVV